MPIGRAWSFPPPPEMTIARASMDCGARRICIGFLGNGRRQITREFHQDAGGFKAPGGHYDFGAPLLARPLSCYSAASRAEPVWGLDGMNAATQRKSGGREHLARRAVDKVQRHAAQGPHRDVLRSHLLERVNPLRQADFRCGLAGRFLAAASLGFLPSIGIRISFWPLHAFGFLGGLAPFAGAAS